MSKDVKDGNPPTLLLSLGYLTKTKKLTEDIFEEEHWEKLLQWYNWFLKTQKTSENSFIFRWHDSIPGEGSFNSGMDDFPRIRDSVGHVDCQAWMYFFSKIMESVSSALNKDSK